VETSNERIKLFLNGGHPQSNRIASEGLKTTQIKNELIFLLFNNFFSAVNNFFLGFVSGVSFFFVYVKIVYFGHDIKTVYFGHDIQVVYFGHDIKTVYFGHDIAL